MLDLTDLAIFAQVAETKSFSMAALRLGLSKGTISKHIAALEATLGTQLLMRTTRRVSLTDSGAALLQHCTRILAEADQAAVAMIRANAAPKGVLFVSAPIALGTGLVTPAVADVLRDHPGLAIDLSLTNRVVDIAAEKIDLAVRIAREPNASFLWRPVMPCPTVLCAAPDYLKRSGVPRCPDELRGHACLLYTVPQLWQFWRFYRGDAEAIVPVAGPFCTNSGEAMRAAALRGLGIALTPRFYVEADLAAGTLVRVLEDFVTPEYTAYVVHPFAHRTSPAVLALAERIAERCMAKIGVAEQSMSFALPARSGPTLHPVS